VFTVAVVGLCLTVGTVPDADAAFLYQENFDALAVGHTQPFPGDSGQGGWYAVLAVGDAFGEVQDALGNPGRALHQFAPATNPASLQTIDDRPFAPVAVAGLVTLSFDFYARTSDPTAVNNFIASLTAIGGPHPGFQIIGVGIGAGNGTPKNVTGVNVNLAAFNGTDNNVPVPLTVGQSLAFEQWHSVSVTLDHDLDRYVSITVNGATQDLSVFQPPRSFDGGMALRGALIETLSAGIIPDDVGGVQTDDDIYWDNILLMSDVAPAAVPEPASAGLLAAGGLAVAAVRRRKVRA
jgi:hypothetical protein